MSFSSRYFYDWKSSARAQKRRSDTPPALFDATQSARNVFLFFVFFLFFYPFFFVSVFGVSRHEDILFLSGWLLLSFYGIPFFFSFETLFFFSFFSEREREREVGILFLSRPVSVIRLIISSSSYRTAQFYWSVPSFSFSFIFFLEPSLRLSERKGSRKMGNSIWNRKVWIFFVLLVFFLERPSSRSRATSRKRTKT